MATDSGVAISTAGGTGMSLAPYAGVSVFSARLGNTGFPEPDTTSPPRLTSYVVIPPKNLPSFDPAKFSVIVSIIPGAFTSGAAVGASGVANTVPCPDGA